METSIILARVFAIYMIVTGISMLINRQFMRQMAEELSSSHIAMLIIAVLTLIPGALLVNFHNIWTHDWRVVLTVLCWLILISGVIRTLFPRFIMQMVPKIMGGVGFNIITCFVLVVGVFFAYYGFIVAY